jgi:hypothetical protein
MELSHEAPHRVDAPSSAAMLSACPFRLFMADFMASDTAPLGVPPVPGPRQLVVCLMSVARETPLTSGRLKATMAGTAVDAVSIRPAEDRE